MVFIEKYGHTDLIIPISSNTNELAILRITIALGYKNKAYKKYASQIGCIKSYWAFFSAFHLLWTLVIPLC